MRRCPSYPDLWCHNTSLHKLIPRSQWRQIHVLYLAPYRCMDLLQIYSYLSFQTNQGKGNLQRYIVIVIYSCLKTIHTTGQSCSSHVWNGHTLIGFTITFSSLLSVTVGTHEYTRVLLFIVNVTKSFYYRYITARNIAWVIIERDNKLSLMER